MAILRWTARVLSIVLLAFVILFVVGEGFSRATLTPLEILQMVLFAGVCLGLALGWSRELHGGVLSLGCLVLFYLVNAAAHGSWPRGWGLPLFALPAVLYIASWARHRPFPAGGR